MVIILFNTCLSMSTFSRVSTISFGKLLFLCFCVLCFESNVLNQDIKYMLSLFKKVLVAILFCFHFIKIHLTNDELFIKVLLCKKHAFRAVLSSSYLGEIPESWNSFYPN